MERSDRDVTKKKRGKIKMIFFDSKGGLPKTGRFLNFLLNWDFKRNLAKYGQLGVDALASATPKDTGKTANSWSYEITKDQGKYTIYWKNTNINDGIPIAIIIQYGHGTRNGGYVQGRDYINLALQPIFDQIAEDAWNEVRRA